MHTFAEQKLTRQGCESGSAGIVSVENHDSGSGSRIQPYIYVLIKNL